MKPRKSVQNKTLNNILKEYLDSAKDAEAYEHWQREKKSLSNSKRSIDSFRPQAHQIPQKKRLFRIR